MNSSYSPPLSLRKNQTIYTLRLGSARTRVLSLADSHWAVLLFRGFRLRLGLIANRGWSSLLLRCGR